MLAEMASYYDELKDHDAPITRAMGPGVGGTRSEMSLDLDDLEDLRGGSHHRRSRSSSSNSPNNSNLSLSSWTNEPEATTGNIMMLGGSSLAGYWRASSLDSVVEQDSHDNSDDDEYRSSSDGSFRKNASITPPQHGHRRHHSADDDESFLPAIEESSKSNIYSRSQSWDGCLLDDALSQLKLGDNENEKPGKRVCFEKPARLEVVQEFEKPDYADYNNLYYMAHELQKIRDDFEKETNLNRHVVR